MRYILILSICSALLFSCGNRNNSGAEKDAHEDELYSDGHSHEGENPEEIVFPVSQAERTDFEVQEVVKSPFNEVVKTAGRIMPAQGDQVTLVATVGGVVSFANKKLIEGVQVGSHQQLFYLSSKNVATGDIVAKNKALYEKAKADFERAERLIGDKIISQNEYNAVKQAWEEAQLNYEALASSSTSKGVAVSTPISGYITSLNVSEGDYVEMGAVLGSVSQNRNLILRAEVSQNYLPKLHTITSANFTVPYNNKTYKLSELSGRLLSVGKNAVEGTTLIPITFEFANNGEVVSGSYVEVFLLGAAEECTSIPLTAVTEQQGLYYVYIQLDEEHYERREVELCGNDGLTVKILAGLEEGEKVVTRGAVNVKMAAASGVIPHGHEH